MCRAMPFSARALKKIFDAEIVVKNKWNCGLSWSALLSTTSTRHYSFPIKFFFSLFLHVERVCKCLCKWFRDLVTFSTIFTSYLWSFISNFVACLVFLGMAFSTKREAAIKKIFPPAIITSAEVIIAEYDSILSQWERANFYNHLSNYTNQYFVRHGLTSSWSLITESTIGDR